MTDSVSDTSGLRVLVNEIRTTVIGLYEGVQNLKSQTCKTVTPIKEKVSDEWKFSMRKFHEIRRTHPWETVGLASITAGLLALPAGRSALLRASAFTALVSVCVVNPEYVYDLYQNQIKRRL